MLAGERDDCAVRALALAQIVSECVEVLNRDRDTARDHHRPGLSADPVPRQHLFVEVVHHDLRLQADGVVVALHVTPQFPLRLSGIEFRIVLDRLGQPVIARHRRVVLDDVHDEALLDGLLHRVAVERAVPDSTVRLRDALAEQFQRLALRRRGEREVARVPQQPARLHDAVDPVLVGLVLLDPSRLRECTGHRRRRLATLAGVCLVDDDRKAPVPLAVSDLVQDERELLHRRDDDLLPGLDEPLETARPVRFAHRSPDLRVLANRVADLPVQNAAVGDHDDGVEHRRATALQPDQLMR